MKKLTLNTKLRQKLNRLPDKAGPLTYIGTDPNNFADKPMVAVVGTRKPTPYGKAMTVKLAEELARAGVIIVSGNALGVDVIAQEAALDAGGTVISVLPSGLDNIYPATNRPIAEQIVEQNGTLISEFPPKHMPQAHDFLHRNRLIAALSDAVIVPEAAARSGSLNTASHAHSMQIPVFAVPGNTTSPMSAGTNHLLKHGAHAITEAADILKFLQIDTKKQRRKHDLEGDTEEQTAILQAIAAGNTTTDELQSATGLDITDLQTATTMLEVQGKITSDQLGSWRLL